MASADRDEIILDGDRYLSAAQAAADYGLTRDAIARLARHGKVRGRRLGATGTSKRARCGRT